MNVYRVLFVARNGYQERTKVSAARAHDVYGMVKGKVLEIVIQNEVTYEWRMEFIEDGDILDVDHCDDLLEDGRRFQESLLPSEESRLCLSRSVGNDEDGLLDRSYAYVREDGTLPPKDDEGYVVPAKYRNQLAKALARAKAC